LPILYLYSISKFNGIKAVLNIDPNKIWLVEDLDSFLFCLSCMRGSNKSALMGQISTGGNDNPPFVITEQHHTP